METQREKTEKGKASDHMANERTYLAWIRTAIAIIGLGFVVVKFSLFVKQFSLIVANEAVVIPGKGYSAPIGTFLVALGAVVAVLAYFRYREVRKQIIEEQFFPSSTLIIILTIFILLGSLFLLAYLVPNVF